MKESHDDLYVFKIENFYRYYTSFSRHFSKDALVLVFLMLGHVVDNDGLGVLPRDKLKELDLDDEKKLHECINQFINWKHPIFFGELGPHYFVYQFVK